MDAARFHAVGSIGARDDMLPHPDPGRVRAQQAPAA